MKIIALNGSRRKRGNTAIMIESILAPSIQGGAEAETLFLGDYDIGACTGCEACARSWDCIIKDDFAGIAQKMDEADAIIFASPTYWYSVTSDMKRLIDRCYSLVQFPVSRKDWIGKYDGTGKLCVTAAICEQHEIANMGNTLTLLTDFAKDIGLDVVDSVAGLGCFEAGSIKSNPNLLQEAETAGEKLFDHLKE